MLFEFPIKRLHKKGAFDEEFLVVCIVLDLSVLVRFIINCPETADASFVYGNSLLDFDV